MGDIHLLTPMQRQRRIGNEIARRRAGTAKLHLEGTPDRTERRAENQQYLAEQRQHSSAVGTGSMTPADFSHEVEALITKAQAAGVSIEEEIVALQGLLGALKEVAP